MRGMKECFKLVKLVHMDHLGNLVLVFIYSFYYYYYFFYLIQYNFICQKFKLSNNYLQDKRLKERLNIYMIIAFDYFSKFYNKW